jgi:hypothetical protein
MTGDIQELLWFTSGLLKMSQLPPALSSCDVVMSSRLLGLPLANVPGSLLIPKVKLEFLGP